MEEYISGFYHQPSTLIWRDGYSYLFYHAYYMSSYNRGDNPSFGSYLSLSPEDIRYINHVSRIAVTRNNIYFVDDTGVTKVSLEIDVSFARSRYGQISSSLGETVIYLVDSKNSLHVMIVDTSSSTKEIYMKKFPWKVETLVIIGLDVFVLCENEELLYVQNKVFGKEICFDVKLIETNVTKLYRTCDKVFYMRRKSTEEYRPSFYVFCRKEEEEGKLADGFYFRPTDRRILTNEGPYFLHAVESKIEDIRSSFSYRKFILTNRGELYKFTRVSRGKRRGKKSVITLIDTDIKDMIDGCLLFILKSDGTFSVRQDYNSPAIELTRDTGISLTPPAISNRLSKSARKER